MEFLYELNAIVHMQSIFSTKYQCLSPPIVVLHEYLKIRVKYKYFFSRDELLAGTLKVSSV